MSVESVGLTCPRCEAPVPADARFCMSCGQSLDDAMAGWRAPGALRRRAGAARREDARAKLTGERKPVTALFADVVGSTTLAEQMDPEDWTQIINEAFDADVEGASSATRARSRSSRATRCSRSSARRSPTRTIPNARSARRSRWSTPSTSTRPAQGDPRHRLPDPRRHQHRAGDRRQRRQRPALRVHGARRRGERRGADADRGRARHGPDHGADAALHRRRRSTSRTSATSRSRARPSRSTPIASLGLQGGAGTLARPRAGRAREPDGRPRRRSSQHAADAFDVVRAGRGRVAVMLGEPGIGKCRLLAELRAAIGRTRATRTSRGSRGAACRYGRSRALPPRSFDLVRSMLDLPPTADDRAAARALDDAPRAMLLGRRPRRRDAVLRAPARAAAAGAETEHACQARSRARSRPATSRALSRVVRPLAGDRPIVLVCEDIHWADPASVDVMVQLLPLLTAAAGPAPVRRPRRDRRARLAARQPAALDASATR